MWCQPPGDILDAAGEALAVSATCWTIRALPREMADEHGTSQPCAGRDSELDYEDVFVKLNDRKSNDKLHPAARPKEKADAVRQACVEGGWQGIVLLEDTKRWYPQGILPLRFWGPRMWTTTAWRASN